MRTETDRSASPNRQDISHRRGRVLTWLTSTDSGRAVVFALAGRIFYSAVAAMVAPHLHFSQQLIRSNAFTETLLTPADGWRYALLGGWQRFDTLWYLHIAQHGYDRPDAMVFYPLYPVLIRITHIDSLVAALCISTLATFLFAWGVQKLIALDHSENVARRTLMLYFAWPAGFILFAGYAESLLLASVAWAVYFQRRGNAGSGGFALLAGASKAAGTFVCVPLLWIAVTRRNARLWIAPIAALVPAALMAVALRSRYGVGMTDIYAQYWRTRTARPWETLWHALHSGDALVWLNLIALGVVVGITLAKRERAEYTAFVIAGALLFLTKQTDPLLQSTVRYVLVLFPAFIAMAKLPRSERYFYAVLAMLFAIEMKLFVVFLSWGLVV